MPNTDESGTGHRQRLRERFLAAGTRGLPEQELLELLLTYAIPRQDVAPIACELLERFGDLSGALSASHQQLLDVPGIGEHAAILMEVVTQLSANARSQKEPVVPAIDQPRLFESEQDLGPLFKSRREREEPTMHTFANDEFANAMAFVPEASQFESYEAYRAHLSDRLPYNSGSTRSRRANEILKRFFPDQRLDTPLAYYASHCDSPDDLKPVLFYHLLKVEPLVAKVADELVWPALPMGRVEREAMRQFVLRCLPGLRPSSLTKALQSLHNAYHLSSTGTKDEESMRFQTHAGTLESYLYILTAEFPQPGMYRFELLEQGPMRTWLLWDREWMERQLYNLRDLGILSKVSQIDTVRQFTLDYDQWTALRHYFDHPELRGRALRESNQTDSTE